MVIPSELPSIVKVGHAHAGMGKQKVDNTEQFRDLATIIVNFLFFFPSCIKYLIPSIHSFILFSSIHPSRLFIMTIALVNLSFRLSTVFVYKKLGIPIEFLRK